MAGVRRILRGLFHQIIGGRGEETPLLSNFIIASASERFELRTLWGWSAATHEAHARAFRLLKKNLSPAQRDQYERRGYFDVIGGETGRRYRIRSGSQANVVQLGKNGRSERVLCFMPEGELVVGDVMLAQKLALELFEEDALRVANRAAPNPYLLGLMP